MTIISNWEDIDVQEYVLPKRYIIDKSPRITPVGFFPKKEAEIKFKLYLEQEEKRIENENIEKKRLEEEIRDAQIENVVMHIKPTPQIENIKYRKPYKKITPKVLSYEEHKRHLKIASNRTRSNEWNEIQIKRFEDGIQGEKKADSWHDRIRDEIDKQKVKRIEKIRRESEFISKSVCKIEVVKPKKKIPREILVPPPTASWSTIASRSTKTEKTKKSEPAPTPSKPAPKASEPVPKNPNQRSKKLCKFYNNCRNKNCTFAHVLEDTIICNFNTRCTNPKCTFRHSEDSLEILYKRIYN